MVKQFNEFHGVLKRLLTSLFGWIRKPTSERFSHSFLGSRSGSYPRLSVYPNLTLRRPAPVDTCRIHGTGIPLQSSLASRQRCEVDRMGRHGSFGTKSKCEHCLLRIGSSGPKRNDSDTVGPGSLQVSAKAAKRVSELFPSAPSPGHNPQQAPNGA
jgi:hypothetical protein